MNEVKVKKHKKIIKQKYQKQNKQQLPLPPYLCQTYPVFYGKQKCIDNQYFEVNQKMVLEDSLKCEQLLQNFIIGEKQTVAKTEQLLQLTLSNEANFDSGLSFYSCKNIIFNEYLVCLKFYSLFRLNNADFSQGQALKLYQRLVYLKTLINKLGPVEKKLEYQKNKLLKKGERIKVKEFKKRTEANNNENEQERQQQAQSDDENQQQLPQPEQEENDDDNLAYKPMVKKLIAQKHKEDDKEIQERKYIAPKQNSILPAQDKAKRREERQKQRRKAYLMRKFIGDIEEGDEAEERDFLEGVDLRIKKRFEEKQRYEQENFTRLNETKQQKYWKKQMQKNRFKNTMNDELNEIKMVREIIEQQSIKPKPLNSVSAKKKTITKRKTE